MNATQNRMGILGLERLVEVKRPKGMVVLIPRVDVYLDISSGEAIEEHAFQGNTNHVVDEVLKSEVTSIEELCSRIVALLLGKYPSARGAEVTAEAEYVVVRRTPVSRQKTQEMYKILGRAVSEDGKIRKMVGVEVTGISSCPCAHEGLLEHSRQVLEGSFTGGDIERILKTVPVASHNQRNVAQVFLEVPEGHEGEIEAEDLIVLLEKSMSSQLYEVLKREDEVALVLKAHENPNFVEDVVRKVLIGIVRRYPDLPGDTMVFVRSESFETIHQHNAIAERLARFRDLKKDVAKE